jgi:hypothetical protein
MISKNELKLHQAYEKAQYDILAATGVSEPNDLILKFESQNETFENLKDLKA